MANSKKTSIIGCLLGTAVGDALGLPMEGLSKQRQQRIFPTITLKNIFDPGADEFMDLVKKAAESALSGEPTGIFASQLGLEKGNLCFSIPVSVYTWYLGRLDKIEPIQ